MSLNKQLFLMFTFLQNSILSLSFFYLHTKKNDYNSKIDYNSSISNIEPISSLVPQGSILGPLLFIIYINDFSKCIKYSNNLSFADNTMIILSAKNNSLLF